MRTSAENRGPRRRSEDQVTPNCLAFFVMVNGCLLYGANKRPHAPRRAKHVRVRGIDQTKDVLELWSCGVLEPCRAELSAVLSFGLTADLVQSQFCGMASE